MHLSLDGYCATAEGGLDWVSYDDELQSWADELIKNIVGSPVYGRVTYELMKSYWPGVLKDQSASERDMNHAKWLENVEKIVFSKSMKNDDWNNTTFISGDLAGEINKLKDKSGKDLVIFGSPSLVKQLLDLGLIDEYHFSVSPVILGNGKSPFHNLKEKVKLKLLDSKILKSGATVLHYQTVK